MFNTWMMVTNAGIMTGVWVTLICLLLDVIQMNTEQTTYPEALEVLRGAYEREKIKLTVMISTHEVTISQQTIQINNLKEKLEKAQSIVADNVQTILRLQNSTNKNWLSEELECNA